ncbi:hypothetical protein BVZ80_01349B, partial [Haemophilus influenzae]
SWARRCV